MIISAPNLFYNRCVNRLYCQRSCKQTCILLREHFEQTQTQVQKEARPETNAVRQQSEAQERKQHAMSFKPEANQW